LLAQNPLRLSRANLALKHFFAASQYCTGLMLDDAPPNQAICNYIRSPTAVISAGAFGE